MGRAAEKLVDNGHEVRSLVDGDWVETDDE